MAQSVKGFLKHEDLSLDFQNPWEGHTCQHVPVTSVPGTGVETKESWILADQLAEKSEIHVQWQALSQNKTNKWKNKQQQPQPLDFIYKH